MLQRTTGPQGLPGAAVTGVHDQGRREVPFMTERLMPGHMILQCGHRYHGNRGLAPSFTPMFCLRGERSRLRITPNTSLTVRAGNGALRAVG